MAVLLALISAVAYGTSDFVGGVVARRAAAWPVAVVGQTSAGVFSLAGALVLGGDPGADDLVWGALAGVGGGIGAAFLYRGLAAGRMTVVAPISALGSALVPVVAGLLGGERPSLLATVGIVAAFPAIWLISSSHGAPTAGAGAAAGGVASGVVDGVLAGLGFGFLFVLLARVDDGAGLMPVAASQVTSVAAVVVTALVLRESWRPTRAAAPAAAMGPLGAVAVGCFLYATQTGLLTVVSVIASLYPALTVLLAAVVLRERVHRVQAYGLGLAALAVALVAAA